MSDPRRTDEPPKTSPVVPLSYASPETTRPDITARIVIGLLITFTALAGVFFVILIYMSRIG